MAVTPSDQKRYEQSTLPIVDLSPFFRDGMQADKQIAADGLVAACKEIGFVYVKGHGVARELIEEAFDVTEKFYALPTEEKMKAPHPPGWAIHRGYSWPGLEKVSNETSTDAAHGLAEKLREVRDFKVGKVALSRRDLTQENRKATRLAPKKIPTCLTCGRRMQYCLHGVLS